MTMNHVRHFRRGISLMEVLISMGILTIGLVSVLSLVPAGHSQALKASAIDRSSALALNAYADFVNRGYLRPSAWKPEIPNGCVFVAFDPIDQSNVWASLSVAMLSPRVDAATSASSANLLSAASSGVKDILMRSEDDILYSTDTVGPDDPPTAVWSPANPVGRHAFDGNFSYLATLSGTSSVWDAGELKTLTIVTFNRRDVSSRPVILAPVNATSGVWSVENPSDVPSGMSLKDLIKPGAMVLAQDSGILQWKKVLMAADATDPSSPNAWRVGFTCEGLDVSSSNTNNRVYVFVGANGSMQLPVRLEGTSVWND